MYNTDITSTKPEDMNAEQKFGQFLDWYLYPSLHEQFGWDWKRNYNRDLQFLGVDGYLSRNGVEDIVDEKATLKFMNIDIGTFAQETTFTQKDGKVVEGWFFNPDKINNYFLYCYPYAIHTNLRTIQPSDFIGARCILVKKSTIQDFLINKGCTREVAAYYAKIVRDGGVAGHNYININGNIIDFHFSPQLAESPVNILIKKRDLEAMAEFKCIIGEGKWGLTPYEKWGVLPDKYR